MDDPIFQHPLAYLLGLEGLALLRGWAGDYDEKFTRERLNEVRRLLDEPALAGHPGVSVARGSLEDGYRQWAPVYDGPNRLFELDEPFVYGIVDNLPPGPALDVACGTGRFAEGLVQRGHQVTGIDGNEGMLAQARRRVPTAEFVLGDLSRLPVPAESADLAVCTLALSHVRSLPEVMAEFHRVLRPGGHLIISDVHHEQVFRGSVIAALGPGGEPGLVPTYRHLTGDYLRAALSHGLQVRACEEPTAVSAQSVPSAEPDLRELGLWREWPWSLLGLIPQARDAAWHTPLVINWHFQRSE
ncbi:class I SAM-dependent methyltransferase [Kineosporia babensis]|uniref:Class I SAM-dependent methyltransferase n=1 Tax=Kineosporia babensis TaxID=499548 RepID=A0A9X1N9T6_9ACTN|nr:class I SAM-dependent methyltransferase [Kineosporia babensis]MCD5311017.1 class I SAM-dependent methyltransferase [Kineosporia babensis]